jgi:hypothetical protein
VKLDETFEAPVDADSDMSSDSESDIGERTEAGLPVYIVVVIGRRVTKRVDKNSNSQNYRFICDIVLVHLRTDHLCVHAHPSHEWWTPS